MICEKLEKASGLCVEGWKEATYSGEGPQTGYGESHHCKQSGGKAMYD